MSALLSDDEAAGGLVGSLPRHPFDCLLRIILRPISHAYQPPKPDSRGQLSNGPARASGSRCCCAGAAGCSSSYPDAVHGEGTRQLQDHQSHASESQASRPSGGNPLRAVRRACWQPNVCRYRPVPGGSTKQQPELGSALPRPVCRRVEGVASVPLTLGPDTT
jgi:hypothetical protein